MSAWLPQVLPGLVPWMSEWHLAKGESWLTQLLEKLASADAVLACITSDNIRAPWIYFEAGAIAGKASAGRVFSYLVGVDKSCLQNTPLSSYQWTMATKDDTWRLVSNLNAVLALRHDQSLLQHGFRSRWKTLKKTLDAVTVDPAQDTEVHPPPTASDNAPFDKDDIVSALEAWLARNPQTDLSPPLRFTELDKALGLPVGSSRKYLEQAATSLNYIVRNAGGQTVRLRLVRR
jgi:hypothetical protein